MLVIAHRGASGNAPENTLAAFKKAVALGAAFIETDLQLSRDAHFVAIHDATVNRTTNGQGAVHDMKLAELRRLDAGSWFGSEFAGERIPTLEEILEFSKKNDVVFYLEIKPGGSWGGEHALVGALRESGEIPRTVVISFDPAIVLSVRKIEPTLMTGLLYDGQLENPLEKAGADCRSPEERSAGGVLDGESSRTHADARRRGRRRNYERLSGPAGGGGEKRSRERLLRAGVHHEPARWAWRAAS
jgi:glycerophosphoryl diester phosphodiesterase